MNARRPIDVVAARLEIVHGAPPSLRAKCPSHKSRGGTLAVKETRDGTVLLHCHAGCGLDAILIAASLAIGDLFPDASAHAERKRDRFAARKSYLRDPHAETVNALRVALSELRKSLRDELGYDPPLHAHHLNDARRRVCLDLNLPEWRLPPLPAREWERLPFSMDPAWPALYGRALEEETRRRWHALNADAQAWETDPSGPCLYDRIRAERLARSWQQAMAAE